MCAFSSGDSTLTSSFKTFAILLPLSLPSSLSHTSSIGGEFVDNLTFIWEGMHERNAWGRVPVVGTDDKVALIAITQWVVIAFHSGLMATINAATRAAEGAFAHSLVSLSLFPCLSLALCSLAPTVEARGGEEARVAGIGAGERPLSLR